MKNQTVISLCRSVALVVLLGIGTIDARLSTCLAQSALTISCPSNIVVSACDVRGTVVNWPNPSCLSNGVPLAQPVICNPPSGSLFPVGITTIHCQASSSGTNSVQATFTVTVQDDGGSALDANSNGLSDIWEIIFNVQDLAPKDDTDGDGLTNEQEAIAGTNPFDPGFRGGIYVATGDVDQSDSPFAGRTIRLRIASVSHMGKSLQWQASSHPTGPWTNLSRTSHCEFRIDLSSTNLPAWLSKQAFFRVLVSDVDEDRDGVTAWEESILGTSDHEADTGWGNDWISGGTGQDGTNSTAGGGSGDDVLIGGITAFDQECARGGHGRDLLVGGLGSDLGTNSSSGYGGAGLDVLIGNTGGDRLSALDWIAAHWSKPRLREVAIAHIGHGSGGLTDARVVVATGTGGELDLGIWSSNFGRVDPLLSTNREPPLAGWTVYLDVLEPEQPSALTLNPFVVGRIGADSNLWLSLRRADEAGKQMELSTARFGTNENIRVLDYAMAHRATIDANGAEQFFLVTPVIGFNSTNGVDYTHPDLYIIIWSVSPPTGTVTFFDASGPLGHTNLPPKGARLQIVREADGRFVVSYLNRQAQLEYLFLDVDASGIATHYGRGTFTLRFDGATTAPVVAPDFALGRLSSNRFTTMLPDTNCTAGIAVWKRKDRAPDCDVDCDSIPVLDTNRVIALVGGARIETPRVNGFALCRIHNDLAVSAVISGSSTLRLDAWKLLADGQMVLANSATNIITGLAPGGGPHVKAFKGTTPVLLNSEFDVLTGRLEDGQFRLDHWRVSTGPVLKK